MAEARPILQDGEGVTRSVHVVRGRVYQQVHVVRGTSEPVVNHRGATHDRIAHAVFVEAARYSREICVRRYSRALRATCSASAEEEVSITLADRFVGADIPYVGRGLSLLLIVPDEGRFERQGAQTVVSTGPGGGRGLDQRRPGWTPSRAT